MSLWVSMLPMDFVAGTLQKHSHSAQVQWWRGNDCSFPLDGIAGKQAFQFFGCVWHGCDFCWANRNRDGTLKVLNFYGYKVEELRKDTLEITKKIEDAGYEVISIRECEWNVLKKRPEVAEFVKTLKSVQP